MDYTILVHSLLKPHGTPLKEVECKIKALLSQRTKGHAKSKILLALKISSSPFQPLWTVLKEIYFVHLCCSTFYKIIIKKAMPYRRKKLPWLLVEILGHFHLYSKSL